MDKATITNTVTAERIEVMFNPEEYTVSRDVNFAQTAVPGLSAPLVQFVHGNAQTLDTPRTAFSHTGTGSNSATFAPTMIFAVPAPAVAGTYTGTVTHSLA